MDKFHRYLPGLKDGLYISPIYLPFGIRITCNNPGQLFLQYAANGPVDVLVRPENVAVRPAPAHRTDRVRSVLFFGHDQLVTVELASGRQLDARVSPIYNFAIGQPVAVQVNGLVMAYQRVS